MPTCEGGRIANPKNVAPTVLSMKSVLGGCGPINFCKDFCMAAVAFDYFLGRPFAKSVGPNDEFIKSVLGGYGPINKP